MSSITSPLPNHIISNRKAVVLLTLDTLLERGIGESHPLYIEVENMPAIDKEKKQYSLIIEWPDKTTAIFSSSEPLALQQLFPAQLAEAYRRSFFDKQRDYWLG